MNESTNPAAGELTMDQMVATLITFDKAMTSRNLAEMREAVTSDFTWEIPGKHRIAGVTIGAEQAIDRAEDIAPFEVRTEFLSTKPTGPLSLEIVVRDTSDHNGKKLDVTLTDQATFSPDGRLASLISGQDQATTEKTNAFFG